MNGDFHYYATYCAAYLAGYSHKECMEICYSAQLVDFCSRTFLSKNKGPSNAATTQLQLEMADTKTDIVGLLDITRIWSSFHFLPYDLYANPPKGTKSYKNKYRLICGPNGDLLVDTVRLAKGKSLQAVGIAMHVLADTWAHRYFAGTPSYVINNINYYIYEMIPSPEGEVERQITFRHSTSAPDNLQKSIFSNSLHQMSENSIMNLGHGRAGHIPDYSFMRYKYLPAWGDYDLIIKDNPSDYYKAFTQMIYAMKYLNGSIDTFAKDTYESDAVSGYEDEITQILEKRQLDASEDWKEFGESLSGEEIEPFDIEKHEIEYSLAPPHGKDYSYLGKFFNAAMAQKSMVTDRIFKSGNFLAGFSIEKIIRGDIDDERKTIY